MQTRWSEYEDEKLLQLLDKNLTYNEMIIAFKQDPQCRDVTPKSLEGRAYRLRHPPPAEDPRNITVINRDFPDEKELYILPLGDIHWDSMYCDKKLLRAKIAEIKEKRHMTLVMGDTFDKMWFQDMRRDEQDTSLNDAFENVRALLEPIQKQILGIVIGNHEIALARRTGFDMVRELARSLGVPLVESLAILHLRVGWHDQEHLNSYVGLVAHGWGAGRTAGAKANNAVRLGQLVANVDFTIMGHVHEPLVLPKGVYRYDPTKRLVTAKTIWNLIVGAFQKDAKYALQKAMLPTAEVEQLLYLSGTHKYLEVLFRPSRR